MPVNDELIRQLNMAGLDHTVAKLLAAKHDEMRVLKVALDPRSPDFFTGINFGELRPGELLLGYLAAVAEPYLAPVSALPHHDAEAAPTLPLTIVADTNDRIGTGGGDRTLPAGVYTTVQQLADLLNGVPTIADRATVSVVGGKLRVQVAQNAAVFIGTAANLHPVDVAAFGFTASPVVVSAPKAFAHVLPGVEVPGGPTEMLGFELSLLDTLEGVLAQPSSVGGLFSPASLLGYLPPGSDPLPLRVAVTDQDPTVPFVSDGSGQAFAVLWLLALD